MHQNIQNNLINSIYKLYYDNLHNINDNLIDKNVEIHFATLISNTFNKTIDDAIKNLQLENTEHFSFSINFPYTNYIDYLIEHLENKSDTGSFLAAQFIKDINKIETFPPSVQMIYNVSFSKDGYVIGRASTKYDEICVNIKSIYNNILITSMEKDIHKDIQLLIPDISDKKSHIISENICRNVLLFQTNLNKKLIFLSSDEFLKVLSHSDYIELNKHHIEIESISKIMYNVQNNSKKI